MSRLRVRPKSPTTACSSATVAFDWRQLNGATPVRDQGVCGTCWIFGAHGSFEGNWAITNGSLIDSSEQNTQDCNNKGERCTQGGWPSDALGYLESSGSATEASYPYLAQNSTCQTPPRGQPYKLYTWGFVSSDDSIPTVEQMKEALCFHGPLAVGVIATDAMQSYGTDEVFNEHASGGVNHVVTLIGWNEDKHAG
jgi:C1A family cysteine protease